ncbi:MAG: hypothetical protein EGR16_05725, partial [Clostridiales bacterium]|nr:hypothetical protein [Clostridiales bacterium]
MQSLRLQTKYFAIPRNLLLWTENSKLHPLVKSCVFRYEFELIHPFLDGNGRCGRLWHTLILSKWNPVFAETSATDNSPDLSIEHAYSRRFFLIYSATPILQ